MASEFAHRVRSAELDLALPHLPARSRLLELGAGDGWQARELSGRGFTVTAVDIEASADRSRYFPVALYDGQALPFPSESFDAIYSSNVLEHVADFGALQGELARVLSPGGVAVHCLPTAVWRFWTSVGHPLYAARWALRLRPGQRDTAADARVAERHRELGTAGLLWRGLVPPRHGEHGNVLSEHWRFSRWSWARQFRETGWAIVEVRPSKLFYSGNELLGLRLGNRPRRLFAAVLGSSTVVYVVRPAAPP
jgi:SAM-dependent methyltransferase